MIEVETLIEPGDVVKLKEPYEPANEDKSYSHGVVTEVVSTNMRSIHDLGDDVETEAAANPIAPRNVSCFMFDPESKELYIQKPGPGDHGIPQFVDHHVAELVLVMKASDTTYKSRYLDVGEQLGYDIDFEA